MPLCVAKAGSDSTEYEDVLPFGTFPGEIQPPGGASSDKDGRIPFVASDEEHCFAGD